MKTNSGTFHLDKWFLDFVSESGEVFIFYVARLKWHTITVPYTSILHYSPGEGMHIKSRFYKVNMPQKANNHVITWSDSDFKVVGTWTPVAPPIHQRIFDSGHGYLDWNCYQPGSDVELLVNGHKLRGRGYAEQLILTSPPWNIPMDELRWGRFGSDAHQMVWIELREDKTRKWFWWNGELIEENEISDDLIFLPKQGITLQLDREVVLESEKKIYSVVKNLIKYLPGFNKVMPVHFLMADEHKWLSKGVLAKGPQVVANGFAIHELVNFKPVLT